MCGQTAWKAPNCFRSAGAGLLQLGQWPWAAEDAGTLWSSAFAQLLPR
jgi:hypothetical protein